MSHLTDEQFEDILQGRAAVPAHADQCPQCRACLAERQALARRVRHAFSAIPTRPDLAGRIKAEIAAARPVAVIETGLRIVPIRARRRVWSGLAVAATILMVVFLRSPYVDALSPTQAAQMALVGIHRINLDSLEQMMVQNDLDTPCACLKREAGGLAMPCCRRGLCVCGCQVRDFRGRQVECCLIRQPNSPAVSVVVVPESPQALGMTSGRRTTAAGQPIWQARRGACNLASVRLGDGSCCVIGEVSHEDLIAVLNALEE